MVFNKKKKYIAVFTILEGSIHNIIATRKVNPLNKSVRIQKKTFIIDIATPSYQKGNKVFYFFSLSTQKQLVFKNSFEPNVNIELIDAIMSQKIIEQLTANLNQDFKLNIMWLLIGGLIGGLIGYMLCQYTMTQTATPSLLGGLL